MKRFYDKFYSLVRSSSDSELAAFKNILNAEITKEIDLRRSHGFSVKQRLCGSIQKTPEPIPSKRKDYAKRIKYIQFVSSQDWSYLYDSESLSKEKKFYVYAHIDPGKKPFDLRKQLNIDGVPFYIGKGTGGRAWETRRNQGHDRKFSEVLKNGYGINHIVSIVKDGLAESDALEFESKLIYLFQTVYEDQFNGVLYNLDVGKRPDFSIKKEKDQKQCKNSVIVRRNGCKHGAV